MKIEFVVRKACLKDVPILVHYKLTNIFEYAKDVTLEDKKKIESYVQTDIQKELENVQ